MFNYLFPFVESGKLLTTLNLLCQWDFKMSFIGKDLNDEDIQTALLRGLKTFR